MTDWLYAALGFAGATSLALLPARRRIGLAALIGAAVVAWTAPVSAMLFVFLLLIVAAVQTWRPKSWLSLAVGLPLATLVAGKVLEAGGWAALPLGISFATFKLIQYVIECQRGGMAPASLTQLFAWIFWPPTLTAGPINRLDGFVFADQTRHDIVEGSYRVLFGLVKLLLIVHLLLKPRLLLETAISDPTQVACLRLWGTLVLSYLVTYIEFSAYCDLAIGGSRIVGISLPENFRWPIFARNPADFWRRWHISLSQWCSNYVFMPALGAWRRPLVAIPLSFLVMGVWHSFSFCRLGWAAWHSLGVGGVMLWQRSAGTTSPTIGQWRAACAIIATQLFVVASHAFIAFGEHRPPSFLLALLRSLVGYSP